MLEIIKQHFFPSFINSFAVIYVLMKLTKQKINLKKFNLYFTLLLFIFSGIFNFFYMNNFIKLLFMTSIVFIGNFILFHLPVKETLISSVFEQIVVVISEIILTLICLLIFPFNITEIKDYLFGNVFGVFWVSILMIIIANFKLTLIIYEKFLKITNKIIFVKLLILFVLIIIPINILIFISFLQLGYNIIFLVNVFFVIVYSYIFYYALYEKNENIFFKEQNKNLLNTLNEYEKMLDYQRINNHENKNQLLVIKAMIEKKDKKLLDYIGEIIKERREDNDVIYTKTKMIPSGGLQGLIYQKMLVMQENKIEVILDVNKQVRKIDMNNISAKMNYDICRIIGIILDNAIEEVMKFNKKDREIIISMYVDDLFFIEVSNKVNNTIDITKIKEKGYTTKGDEHGYGLNLLEKIIKDNNRIYNEVKIINNVFTQIVKIKM